MKFLLEPRVHGFALEGKNAEDAFVDSVERFGAGEALQRLDTEAELAERQGALAAETAASQPVELIGLQVLGAIDDP
jgi:hypothetical protein